MTQLTEKIREALLGNVGTIICGRIGVTDAELMVKAFTPTFTAEDLTKTPNFAAVTKVMMFDMPSAPFTMSLPPLMGEPNVDLMNSLKAYSATKYAKTREEVEREIQDRWNSANEANEDEEKQPTAPEEPTGATVSAPSHSDDNIPTPQPKPASDDENSSEAGFLDGWLNKQND